MFISHVIRIVNGILIVSTLIYFNSNPMSHTMSHSMSKEDIVRVD